MKISKSLLLVLVLVIILGFSELAFAVDKFDICKNGTPEEIKEVLSQGADVNARDKDGRTVLMWAAAYNQNPEVITTLIKAGADMNARDKGGLTVLMHVAMFNQNPEVITTLIKAGADAKIVDNHGKKAIDYAEENEKLKGSSAYWELNDASY